MIVAGSGSLVAFHLSASLALRYIGGERASPLGQSGLAGLTASVMTRSTKHLRPGDYERLPLWASQP